MRSVLVALVAVGLAIGVFVLWPNADDEDPPTTEAILTTTTTAGTPTTQPPPTTTTASESGSHVVETVEEAEEILRAHYYVWFHSIYAQDADSIRSLVILEDQAQAAITQFGQMEFESEPTPSGIIVSDVSILKAHNDCLAIDSTVAADFRAGSTSGVVVFRRVGDSWKMLSSWTSANDLWEADCESSL